MTMNKEFISLVQDAAMRAARMNQKAALAGRFETLYLYAFPSEQGKGPGKLVLIPDSEESPDGAVLVTGEGLQCSVPYDYYFAWIEQRSRRAPILSF
jgi:hypothetical protein